MSKKDDGRNWFINQFLPSLDERMTNPKYPNSCIISRNQAEVCRRYMEERECHGDYGFFHMPEIDANGNHYYITHVGKYYFLNREGRA